MKLVHVFSGYFVLGQVRVAYDRYGHVRSGYGMLVQLIPD